MAKQIQKPKNAYALLDRVCEAILEEPAAYNQQTWMEKDQGKLKEYLNHAAFPPCGTVCCVAGHIAFRAGRRINDRWDIEPEALALLGFGRGVDPAFRKSIRRLFSGRALLNATGVQPGTPEYARRGVMRIRRFMRHWEERLKRTKVK